MDNFNKVISFVLGLIVVIVLLVLITGRLRIRERFMSLIGKSKSSASIYASPTPTQREKFLAQLDTTVTPSQSAQPTTPFPTLTIAPTIKPKNTEIVAKTKVPTSIPKTGAPTILLAVAPAALLFGLQLRKTK